MILIQNAAGMVFDGRMSSVFLAMIATCDVKVRNLKYNILLAATLCLVWSPVVLGDQWLPFTSATGAILIGVLSYFADQYTDVSMVARFLVWNADMREWWREEVNYRREGWYAIIFWVLFMAVLYSHVFDLADSLGIHWVILPLSSFALAGCFALILRH